MKRDWIAWCAIGLASTPATAQGQQITSGPDIATRAVGRACQDMYGRQIPTARLDQALRIEARLNDLDGDAGLSAPQLAEALRDRANLLSEATSYLQQQLALPETPLAKALSVSPAPPPGDPPRPNNWLFSGSPYVLTCAPARPAEPAAFPRIATLVLRGSVEELSEVGEDRRAAGAARIGWDRLRTTDLGGQTSRTNTITVDATVALASGTTDRYGMIYADYSLSRVRKSTTPEETPEEADGRADDVDALEVGVLGTVRPASWIRATGRIGVTFDSVVDARYIHGGLTLVPITGGRPNLGLCSLNAFRLIGLGIEGRCTLAGEADIRYVLRQGRAALDDSDTLFALGGVIGADFRRALDLSGSPQDGLVASVTYRYLPLIDGNGPDIDRFDASLGYRWWAGDLGFELGLTYADGTERKSLADENRVGVTFGIIY